MQIQIIVSNMFLLLIAFDRPFSETLFGGLNIAHFGLVLSFQKIIFYQMFLPEHIFSKIE